MKIKKHTLQELNFQGNFKQTLQQQGSIIILNQYWETKIKLKILILIKKMGKIISKNLEI